MLVDRQYTVPPRFHEIKESDFTGEFINKNPLVLEGVRQVTNGSSMSAGTHPSVVVANAQAAASTDSNSSHVLLAPEQEREQRIVVLFDVESETKTGVKTLRDLMTFMEDNEVTDGIIVSEKGANPALLKELAQINDKGNYLQFFTFAELYRNIARHKLVPQHIGLSDQQARAICQKMKAKPEQFPYLLEKASADGKGTPCPIVKYYGFRRGKMVVIRRHLGGKMHPYYVYRVVH